VTICSATGADGSGLNSLEVRTALRFHSICYDGSTLSSCIMATRVGVAMRDDQRDTSVTVVLCSQFAMKRRCIRLDVWLQDAVRVLRC